MNFAANHKNLQVKSSKNPNSVKEWRAGLEARKKAQDEFQSLLYKQYKNPWELDSDSYPEYRRFTVPKFNSIFGMEDDWMHSEDWDVGCR